ARATLRRLIPMLKAEGRGGAQRPRAVLGPEVPEHSPTGLGTRRLVHYDPLMPRNPGFDNPHVRPVPGLAVQAASVGA
ncbi:hypothetical protein ACWDE9_38150, partial [Streptomyces olivaceoviridis]